MGLHSHYVGITDCRKLEKYKDVVVASTIMFVSNFMKICYLVHML